MLAGHGLIDAKEYSVHVQACWVAGRQTGLDDDFWDYKLLAQKLKEFVYED